MKKPPIKSIKIATLYQADSDTILFDCFFNDWTDKISISHHA